MWSNRKPWWAKKAEENKVDKTHYKDWCVVKVVMGFVPNQWDPAYGYKPCAKLNAPKIFDAEGNLSTTIVVDNLTKHEAHEVAKGLNFLDGGEK